MKTTKNEHGEGMGIKSLPVSQKRYGDLMALSAACGLPLDGPIHVEQGEGMGIQGEGLGIEGDGPAPLAH